MERGVFHTYGDNAYPRYKYLKYRLKRLLPRWQRILDAGGFQECTSKGTVIFDEVTSLAKQIGDKVKVTLFGNAAFLKTGKLELTVQTNASIVGDIKTGEITWDSFLKEKGKRIEPAVTVIGVQSLEEKVVKALEAKLSHMSKAECQNIVIYIYESKTNFTYKDLAKAGFNLQNAIDQSDSGTQDRSASLDQQIQYILEEKVVSVIEIIAAYNKVFVAKEQKDIADSLLDAIQNKLKRSLCNTFIVKDLSPYGKEKSEETERKPTDNELFRISGAVKSDWEVLGPSLGINQEKIADIKKSNQTQESEVYNMLLLWRQKDDATLKFLLEVMQNISRVINVDIEIIKGIEEDFLGLKTDSEIDKIFHKKLLDFVAKTTKCVACEKLSLKYGISEWLINEFLKEGFFEYEKKVEDMMATMSLPSWPKDKSESGVSACKSFLPSCTLGLTKIIQGTEDYISNKLELLTVLNKLQFELYGLLQLTDVAIDTVIPVIPRLPLELQYDLLQIPEVYGCGTVWGVLELHLTTDISSATKEDVKNLLLQHKYMYGYTSQLIEKTQVQVREGVEPGRGLSAKKLVPDTEGEYKHGSIGCFVHVRQTGAKNAPNELHCITCAHCVCDCEDLIKIQNRHEQFEKLGLKKFQKFPGDFLDVATIVIDKDQLKNCEKTLKDSADSPLRHSWSFYDKPAVRMTVFKYGSVSGLTYGICVCSNHKTKDMLEEWNRNSDRNFKPDYNILIALPADVPQNTQIQGIGEAAAGQAMQGRAFSEDGDSGSVVCEDNIDDGDVIVISLLCGDIRKKIDRNSTRFLYSYSTHIKAVVSELERHYDCKIEPDMVESLTIEIPIYQLLYQC